jgi:hypothetical protein
MVKKGKVNLSLCLTKHHGMKTDLVLIKRHAIKAYWENGDMAPRILNLGNRWKMDLEYSA